MNDAFIATGYIQIRPVRSAWNDRVVGARVMRSTQKRPESVAPGCVVVRVEFEVPTTAFDPIRPSARVVIPEELIQHEVQVTATDGDL